MADESLKSEYEADNAIESTMDSVSFVKVSMTDEEFMEYSSSDSDDEGGKVIQKSIKYNIFKGFHIPGKYKGSTDIVPSVSRESLAESKFSEKTGKGNESVDKSEEMLKIEMPVTEERKDMQGENRNPQLKNKYSNINTTQSENKEEYYETSEDVNNQTPGTVDRMHKHSQTSCERDNDGVPSTKENAGEPLPEYTGTFTPSLFTEDKSTGLEHRLEKYELIDVGDLDSTQNKDNCNDKQASQEKEITEGKDEPHDESIDTSTGDFSFVNIAEESKVPVNGNDVAANMKPDLIKTDENEVSTQLVRQSPVGSDDLTSSEDSFHSLKDSEPNKVGDTVDDDTDEHDTSCIDVKLETLDKSVDDTISNEVEESNLTENVVVMETHEVVKHETQVEYQTDMEVGDSKKGCISNLAEDDLESSIEIIGTGTQYSVFRSMTSRMNSEELDWSFIGRPNINISAADIVSNCREGDKSNSTGHGKPDESANATIDRGCLADDHDSSSTPSVSTLSLKDETVNMPKDITVNSIKIPKDNCDSTFNQFSKETNVGSVLSARNELSASVETKSIETTCKSIDSLDQAYDQKNNQDSLTNVDHENQTIAADSVFTLPKSLKEEHLEVNISEKVGNAKYTETENMDIAPGKADVSEKFTELGHEQQIYDTGERKTNRQPMQKQTCLEYAPPPVIPKSPEVLAYLTSLAYKSNENEKGHYVNTILVGPTSPVIRAELELIRKGHDDNDITYQSSNPSKGAILVDQGRQADYEANTNEVVTPVYGQSYPVSAPILNQGSYSLNQLGQMVPTGPSQPLYRPSNPIIQPHISYPSVQPPFQTTPVCPLAPVSSPTQSYPGGPGNGSLFDHAIQSVSASQPMYPGNPSVPVYSPSRVNYQPVPASQPVYPGNPSVPVYSPSRVNYQHVPASQPVYPPIPVVSVYPSSQMRYPCSYPTQSTQSIYPPSAPVTPPVSVYPIQPKQDVEPSYELPQVPIPKRPAPTTSNTMQSVQSENTRGSEASDGPVQRRTDNVADESRQHRFGKRVCLY